MRKFATWVFPLYNHSHLGCSSAKDGAGLAQCPTPPSRQAELYLQVPHSCFFHLCHGFMAQVLYCHLPGSLSDIAGLVYPVSIGQCLVCGLGLDSHQRGGVPSCPDQPPSQPCVPSPGSPCSISELDCLLCFWVKKGCFAFPRFHTALAQSCENSVPHPSFQKR